MRFDQYANYQTIILALFLLFFHFSASGKVKWDMPTAYHESSFHTQNIRDFTHAVEIATGGKLVIQVHSGGALYKGDTIKHAVQTGQVQIGERLLSAHANENAVFAFDSIPFLVDSFEESEKLMNAARPILEKVLLKQNLVLLYSVPWPPTGFYTKTEIKSIQNLKGLKLRSYNSATARMAELSGAIPLQIEASELTQALETGIADSFLSSSATGYDRKVWEYLNFWNDAKVWLPRNYIFVNKQAWEKLDLKTRLIVKGVAYMAEQSGQANAERLSNWYTAQLKKQGMNVHTPNKQLKSDFEKIGKKMEKEWLQKTGLDGQFIKLAFEKAINE